MKKSIDLEIVTSRNQTLFYRMLFLGMLYNTLYLNIQPDDCSDIAETCSCVFVSV